MPSPYYNISEHERAAGEKRKGKGGGGRDETPSRRGSSGALRDGGNGCTDPCARRPAEQGVAHRGHDIVTVRRGRDVLQRDREPGDVSLGGRGRGPEGHRSERRTDRCGDPDV